MFKLIGKNLNYTWLFGVYFIFNILANVIDYNGVVWFVYVVLAIWQYIIAVQF